MARSLILAALLLASLPASAMELKFDKDTGVVLWRCGEVAMAGKIAEAMKTKPVELPDYCQSIGRSLGEVNADAASGKRN